MIVALTGPSGSGKTTVCRELRKRFGFLVVEEVARVVFREKYREYGTLDELRKNPEATLRYQIDILRRQVEEEESAMKKASLVVSDRSIFDGWAYSKLHLPPEYFAKYEKVFSKYARRKYDALFMFHPVRAKEDGFRTIADVKTQRVQLDLIRSVLDRYGVRYVEVPNVSVEERVAMVLKCLPSIEKQLGH